MFRGGCDAGRCGGRQADLAFHLGLDPAYAWTRCREVHQMQRVAFCNSCSACRGPDLPHCRRNLTLSGPATSRDWRRLRPAAAREAVVEAPHPPDTDLGLNRHSPSRHETALAGTVHDAATQQALHSSREWLPEQFEMEAGEVSAVHRAGLDSPADVFRCSGCSLPDCQVRGPTFRAVGST